VTTTACKLTKGTRYDLDSLTFAGWTGPDAAIAHADDTLDCWAYFADSVYLGPDADGVEPLFAAAPDTTLTPRLDSLVCWMEDRDIADAMIELLCECGIDYRTEDDRRSLKVFVAAADHVAAVAAFRGLQCGLMYAGERG
jgi:hypothetical protein